MRRYIANLDNYKLATLDAGMVCPVACIEVLAHDSAAIRTSALIRVSPLQAPVMHGVDVRLHWFYDRCRNLYDGWGDFITGGKDGLGSSEPYPTITSPAGGFPANELPDYLGIPPGVENLTVNLMPIRSANRIWNYYYRDQDLMTESALDNTAVQRCAWGRDYFASARPWAQKGPDVTLPLGSRAPIVGLAKGSQTFGTPGPHTVYETGKSAASTWPGNASPIDGTSGNNAFWAQEDPNNSGFPGFYADLSASEAINMRDFRDAMARQRYQEARARFGSRLVDYYAYLGRRVPERDLSEPEYIGGGKAQIVFSEVLQHAADGQDGAGVGRQMGHGLSLIRGRRITRYFPEHGFLICFASLRPKTMYQDGVHRMWLRRTKEDYFQPELQDVGQQPIKMQEIYANSAESEIFGYQDNYRDYREHPSTVSSEFRDKLNFYHMARKFDTKPALNETFVTCTPTKRIHQEQTQHAFWGMFSHRIRMRRLVNSRAIGRIR